MIETKLAVCACMCVYVHTLLVMIYLPDCAPDCMNGGSCITESDGNTTCQCITGFSGDQCETGEMKVAGTFFAQLVRQCETGETKVTGTLFAQLVR